MRQSMEPPARSISTQTNTHTHTHTHIHKPQGPYMAAKRGRERKKREGAASRQEAEEGFTHFDFFLILCPNRLFKPGTQCELEFVFLKVPTTGNSEKQI